MPLSSCNSFSNRRITKPPTTDRSPTTDHRPTDKFSTDPPTTDPPISAPPIHRPPNQRQILHRPTDHRITDSPTLLQLTNNPLTHQSYFNRVTIGPVLSVTNFNSSFGMGTIITELVKLFIK